MRRSANGETCPHAKSWLDGRPLTETVLTRANLASLAPPVVVPCYDPAAVTPGIVHLGLGGFARAHMARYTHDLMQADPAARSWGIIGAGLRPEDQLMHDALAPQDGLYALMERGGEGEAVTIIGAISRVIFAGQSTAPLLRAIADPTIRIVSLTVTEHGYCLDRATKTLDLDHPLIRHDLEHSGQPASAIGVIVQALRQRMQAGQPPFTALSCDNIQHNGRVLQAAVLALAAMQDRTLAAWIGEHGKFPGTMVDRITPVTTAADRRALADRYGVIDRWPVVAESFRQWVIEDDFALGRPAWESAGAQMVQDVAPYEFMKLRLLNTSHLAVACLGRLAGCVTIDEAMRNTVMRRYMVALMDRETQPTLPHVPGIDLAAYKRNLVARFANAGIRDTVERVNTDAPLNLLLEPIRDRLASGQRIDLLALALAAWLRRMRGEDEQGAPIDIRHPFADALARAAIAGGEDPRPMLSMAPLFGDLAGNENFIETVAAWLSALYRFGAMQTLEKAAANLAF